MVASLGTVSFEGVHVLPIHVEVQISNGLPLFQIVGLPDKAVAESRERVRGALSSMGLALPPKRIVVNLAPADVQKEGSHYDLPIALALLAAMEVLPKDALDSYMVLGELGLDGSVRPVSGVLPTALYAFQKNRTLICPFKNGGEAAWVEGLDIIACSDLLQCINFFKGDQTPAIPTPQMAPGAFPAVDFSDIKGQHLTKRVAEIAAAGGHNFLMVGPPGAGKSMIASALPGILPPLTAKESIELTTIYSVAGLLKEGALMTERPFRDPHHSATLPAIVGGGSRGVPGEITLAHQGILFLDELPEFQRATLDALRQPLETGRAVIARANAHVTYPASFQLVAAMNPCPCGYMGYEGKECARIPFCGAKYKQKLSGPLLDRIDLHVSVAPLKRSDFKSEMGGEKSADIKKRVTQARERQLLRAKTLGANANARLPSKIFDREGLVEASARAKLEHYATIFQLSARAYYRLLKVALTIADLKNEEKITLSAIEEALQYRA